MLENSINSAGLSVATLFVLGCDARMVAKLTSIASIASIAGQLAEDFAQPKAGKPWEFIHEMVSG
jgi:hypothetical protein